jgi:D-lactate dehydrogenase (cytochrome)
MVPVGSLTGLEGGIIPIVPGCVAISTENLQKMQLNPTEMQVTVGAGVRKSTLEKFLKPHNMFFPPDPGSDSCMGGQASTGSSGTTSVKYGTFKENVITLTVVTPEGKLIPLTRTRTRKSSTGYDLTRVFMGSEGTLGIITELVLRIQMIPKVITGALYRFDSLESAVNCVLNAFAKRIDELARGELMSDQAIREANAHFGSQYAVGPTLCVEFHATDEESAQKGQRKFDQAASHAVHREVVSTKEALDTLWKVRRSAYHSTMNSRKGEKGLKVWATDCCVPLPSLPKAITTAELDYLRIFGRSVSIVAHIFDGNFHCTIPYIPSEVKQCEAFEICLAQVALSCGGTVSGEHGVGIGKLKFLQQEHGEVALDVARRIKAALDPRNLMNPGKLIPPRSLL